MRILAFGEGAYPNPASMRLPVVPELCDCLARRGHAVVLCLAGQANIDAQRFVRRSTNGVFVAGWASVGFRMLAHSAFSKWAIAPKMVIRAARYARNADVIMLNSLYSFPVLLGYLLARRYNKPYCLWPHGVLAPFQWRVSAGRKRVYEWLVAQRILSHASAIVFTSQGEREETRSLGLTARSVIIPHGFNSGPYEHLPERGAFRAQYLQGHSGPVVLFLSRLNAKKGLDVLIQAFALVVEHLPDARLAIVGNSDPPAFESKVQAWLRQYRLARHAAMTGPLTGESKRQAFADADVFVLPSHAENFGVVLFEAMASGVPVVVSDTLNYADEIRRSQAGFVVRRDPREFASATLKLLRDSDLRKCMGGNGLRMAQGYSWEACGEKVERTIQCILLGKALPADLTLGG